MKETTRKIRKQNMKIYSLYRAISLDLLFYYAIEFLFITQVKHISPADFVLSSSFYAIFMIAMQIPASITIDRLGTRLCTILANAFNTLFIVLIMCCDNLATLIFAQFISSLCFSLKDISDSTLLQYSIPDSKHKGDIFSRLEGRGYKDYYLLNAVTSAISGFLYVVDPYLPMILALIFTLISTFISFAFEEIPNENQEKQTTKQYFQELMQGMKFIIKSDRLRSLFLYGGIAWGIFSLMKDYRASILVDIGTPEPIITIIAAIVGVASSTGSKVQIQFHNHFRNRTLSTILYMTTGAILIGGITGIIPFSFKFSLIIFTICFIIVHICKGISAVVTTRYLGNFADEKILTQIYAVNAMSRNVFRAIISFLGSYLLRITNTANSMVLIGILLLITTLGLTSYMKTRLGLKPEEYGENDIFNKQNT